MRLRLARPVCGLAVLLAACASSPPDIPYPAFLSVDTLPDIYLAGLPGVRAKPLAGATGDGAAGGYRIDLPSSWAGTSGAAPDKALEIFVIEGELSVADLNLTRGGYAYLPSGTLGFNLKSSTGARVLYFLNSVDRKAVIRTPMIIESNLLEWTGTDVEGISTKELRSDPGTGARTWLVRIEPGARIPWESSSAIREGYFVAGNYMHSECVSGEAATDLYLPGGYVYRAAHAINGGPGASAATTSVWFYREQSASVTTTYGECSVSAVGY